MRMAIHLYEIAFEYEYNCFSAKFFLAKFAFNLYEFFGQDSYKIHELKKFTQIVNIGRDNSIQMQDV